MNRYWITLQELGLMQGRIGSISIQKIIVRLLMKLVVILTASNLEPQQYLKQSLAHRTLQKNYKQTFNRLPFILYVIKPKIDSRGGLVIAGI